jgi:hypothetical protein
MDFSEEYHIEDLAAEPYPLWSLGSFSDICGGQKHCSRTIRATVPQLIEDDASDVRHISDSMFINNRYYIV